MIWRWLQLLPALVLFSPGLLHAQAETKAFDPFKPNAPDNSTMYEDIEIFRRILDRKLHPLYPRINYPSIGKINLNNPYPQLYLNNLYHPSGMPGWQNGLLIAPHETLWSTIAGSPYVLADNRIFWADLTNTLPNRPFRVQEEVRQTLEGVYFKGHGIVYTATLSSLQPAAKAETPKSVSEWENVRRQLHNEKEEPKKAEAAKPPALSDVLLKVLAENGHHFSRLDENESLILVLTVRGANPSPSARKSATETKKTTSQTLLEESGSAVSSKLRDLELLGDLHMKQEHYGQARDAFRKAMELKPTPERAAALARKLAQAYLLLNNIKEARGALDQALALHDRSRG